MVVSFHSVAFDQKTLVFNNMFKLFSMETHFECVLRSKLACLFPCQDSSLFMLDRSLALE
jgi:hypothetical protein